MKPLNSNKTALARLLRPLWWCLGCFFKGTAPVRSPASILVFDFHLIGDIVLLTPLLRALREGYPEAHIALVAGPWSGEILKGTAWVDEIIPFSAPWVKYGQGWHGWRRCIELAVRLHKRDWDLGIEVRGDVRQILLLALAGSKRRIGYDFTGGGPLLTDVVPDDGAPSHLADHHRRIAEYLGIWPAHTGYVPIIRLTDEETRRVRQRSEYCGFHLGASLPLRRLPMKEAIQLVRRVAERVTIPIVLFVSPDDPASSKRLYDALPPPIQNRIELWSGDLRSMMVTLSRATHLYCMDSGTAHIAAAQGVPVTVIYGPAVSTYVRPIGGHVTIVERNDLDCKPCDQIHCSNSIRQCCLTDLVDTL